MNIGNTVTNILLYFHLSLSFQINNGDRKVTNDQIPRKDTIKSDVGQPSIS